MADQSASGSRHSMAYVEELVYGVTPEDPAFKAMRHNTTTLNLTKANFQSQELREDRQITDFRTGAHQVGGNVVTELSATSHDDLLAAALGGTWVGNVLKAGIVRRSFTIERLFADIAARLRFLGVEVDTMQVAATTGAIVTITYGMFGRTSEDATDPLDGATYALPTTTETMDALTGVVTEGGVNIGVATEINLNLSNGLGARHVIGGQGLSLQPSIGRSNVTGTATFFFANMAQYLKFINDESSSLSFQCSSGFSTYTWLLPRLKYTGATVDVSGEGSVSLVMPFQALRDPVTGTNIQITRSA